MYRCHQTFSEWNNVGHWVRSYSVGTWYPWRRVIEEDSTKLTRYTLADFGLTNESFAGKTWEECALIIVNACPHGRVIQYISPHDVNYKNISIALNNTGLASYGTLRYEAGRHVLDPNIPNKFEYNENNKGIFVGFYDNEWCGWRRLDSGVATKTSSFVIDTSMMNCHVNCSHSSGFNVTVPNDSSIPIGSKVTLTQTSNGVISIVNASGVNVFHNIDGIPYSNGIPQTNGLWSVCYLTKKNNTEWVLNGNIKR
jgi:hypothetical protein